MYARPGDHIVIASSFTGGPVREGRVIEVERDNGAPPYLVRWSDSGRESYFVPGNDAHVNRSEPVSGATIPVPSDLPAAQLG